MNKWNYNKNQGVHTYVDTEQSFTWIIKMKKKEDCKFVLNRTWQVPKLLGTVDYIGTFDKLTKAKEVADLIRTG